LSATRRLIIISAVPRKVVLEREHVVLVYTTRILVLRRVIAFETDDGSGDWVFVYSFWPYRILSRLADFDWPVRY
jgi:hypothetical protein